MSHVTAGRPGQEDVLNPKPRRGRICSLASSSSAGPWGANPLLVTRVGPCPAQCSGAALPSPSRGVLFNQNLLFNQATRGDRLVVSDHIWCWLPSTLSCAALHRPGNVSAHPWHDAASNVLLSIMIISCVKTKYSVLFLFSSPCIISVFSEIRVSQTAKKIKPFLQCIYCSYCSLCVSVSE